MKKVRLNEADEEKAAADRAAASIVSQNGLSLRAGSIIRPFQLEFDLFLLAFALVLDVEAGAGWDINPLAGNLDLEFLAGFQRVRQPPQLRHKFLQRIILFDVPFAFAHDCLRMKLNTPGGKMVISKAVSSRIVSWVNGCSPRMDVAPGVNIPE